MNDSHRYSCLFNADSGALKFYPNIIPSQAIQSEIRRVVKPVFKIHISEIYIMIVIDTIFVVTN